MRYPRTLLAAVLALSAAACGRSVSAPEPALDGITPAGPSYGVSYGGGQRGDTTTVASTSNVTTSDSTTTIVENRGNYFGSGN